MIYNVFVKEENLKHDSMVLDNSLEKYRIRQYSDLEKIVRIDTNWVNIFPVTAFNKLPLFTKHRNFLHYYSTVLGFYKNRYTGETFFRLDHGHREPSKLVSWFLMPPNHKENAVKLRYYYWNKYVYLFKKTLSINKIFSWDLGLDFSYHKFQLSCTRYHNFLY